MAARLTQKVAIVTGASRGLGEYCALAFAREGTRVVVAARTTEERDPRLPGTIYHTARLIEEAGGEALPMVCNVGDQQSIDAMVATVLDRWGRIDVLMNNAAIQPPGGNATIVPRHWELLYRINVHGPFHCIRAVLPGMLERGSGSIINISSGATLGGTPYGGSKRALEAMTEGLAAELRGGGVAVNALKPVGAIETPGLRFAQVPRGEVTLPELPSPDSYVEAAVLLALQTSSGTTGRVLNDAQVIALLGDQASKDRFSASNPDYWVRAMAVEP